MIAAALLLALVQAGPPRVAAHVDRDKLAVGEELTYTITVTSGSPQPVDVAVNPPAALAVTARSERTEVGYGTGPTRTTTLELRLLALHPGHWKLGPVRATQGGQTVEVEAIDIEIVDAPAAIAAALNPRLKALLDRARPPTGNGEVGLTLTLAPDTVRVGEQVDIVTAAWFPRDLRHELRRPPVLQPPAIDGAWSYTQPSPPGIAASRQVNGAWYDLFVAHQSVFPLAPAVLHVPPATLKYSVPMALQFFSQEERYTLNSESRTIVALPLPLGGQPADFTGAIGGALKLERTITPATSRVGEAVQVDLSITGQGNPALWPTPELKWPGEVRAYPDRTDEKVETTAGLVGGKKTFRYIVVPDSGGTVTLPDVAYSYFDFQTHAYVTTRVSAARLAVAASAEAATARALPPPLFAPVGAPLAERVATGLPVWVWVLLVASPPIGWVVLGVLRRRRRRPVPRRIPRAATPEHPLERTIRDLVPNAEDRDGARLVASLRGAGVDAALAAKVTALREALLAARYGPPAAAGESIRLGREADALSRELGAARRRRGAAAGGRMAGLVVLALLQGPVEAPSAERLYETGSLRAAATEFEGRTRAEPEDPAHWYALGASLYRMGDGGGATVAWMRAQRLAPRNETITRALRLTPPPDDISGRRRWTAPLTVEEAALVAFAAWVLGWTWLLLRRRKRRVGWTLIGVGVAFALVAVVIAQRNARSLAIVNTGDALRVSPHGRAQELARLPIGAALLVRQRRGDWLLVDTPSSGRGWVATGAVRSVSR